MKEIALTQGQVALVDDVDYEWLCEWKWCAQKASTGFYAVSSTKGGAKARRRIQMHRMILDAPTHLDVDHIDHNGLNNTRANLRLATRQQNMFNKPTSQSNTSGYKGVHWHKRRGLWCATIWRDSRQILLGFFDVPEEAALAYDYAARELFEEFACVNFPNVLDAGIRFQGLEKRKPRRGKRKLTDSQVVEILILANSGLLAREIAAMFGITPQYVSQLKRGMYRRDAVAIESAVR